MFQDNPSAKVLIDEGADLYLPNEVLSYIPLFPLSIFSYDFVTVIRKVIVVF